MDFPRNCHASPLWRFPFKVSAGMLPIPGPNCHLVRTAIPRLPLTDSLGDFRNSAIRFLASFAAMVSKINTGSSLAKKPPAGILSTRTTQGRLHCTQHHYSTAIQVQSCSVGHPSIRKCIGAPQRQVSTAIGSVFHAIEKRPKALTPSTHPKLGVKSRHQRLHRYALRRIFRPALGTARAD